MSRPPAPAPIDDIGAWLQTFLQPGALIELSALAVCVALSWGVARGLKHAFNPDAERSIWFGHRGIDGVLFPLLLLVLAYAARALTALWAPPAEAPDAAEVESPAAVAAPRPADLAPTPHDVELQRAHRLLHSARDAVASMFRDARMGRAIDRQVMPVLAICSELIMSVLR